MAATITPLGEHLGVEVTGLTAADFADPALAAESERLLQRHGVVVFREVHIDDDTLLAFSRRHGELVVQPTGEHSSPEIQTITLDTDRTNALLAAYRRGNFLWHVDGATDVAPQKGTFLSAIEIADPGQGGTEFATTYAAYDALTPEMQERITGLRVVHSFAAAQRRAHPDADEAMRTSWNRVPEREHPLVWTRTDGRRSLLLGATADRIVGWSRHDSDALLAELLEWCTQPGFTLRHDWRRGDLVTWDNTGMLHRALPFEPTSPRLMHRTTLVGVESVA